MFDLRKAPVIRILVPFTAGSLIGYQGIFSLHIVQVVIIALFLWAALILVYIKIEDIYGPYSWLFSINAFLIFTITGFGTGIMTRPQNPGLTERSNVMIRGKIIGEPHVRKMNLTFDMEVDLVVTEDAVFPLHTMVKAYLKIPADSGLPASGQSWQFYGRLAAISNSGNPGTPDYESILQRKNCWYMFFAEELDHLNRRYGNSSDTKISADRIRKKIWSHWNGSSREISLLRAVCLGDRSGLTDEMRQAYSKAGGIHLLAVSGLHVGLIWWVLHHMLSWIVHLFRREECRTLPVVLILWFYAYVTGFSSSVCRSVTMFSFFSLSRLFDRRAQPINGILVSAFILIVLRPARVMDVGFQLSYLAVLGIVTLNPCIIGSLKIKNKLLRWVWEATGVSLSAQMVTAPLVVFYFHQLPLYSLVTNLVAIPLLSLLITFFVISVPCMAIGIVTVPFNWLMLKIGYLLNLTMEVVASMPGSVITNLSMSSMNLVLLMILLLFVMMLPRDPTHLSGYLSVALFSILLISSSHSRLNALYSSEFVVAHFNKGSLVTFREGACVDHYQLAGSRETEEMMEQYVDMVWNSYRYRCKYIKPGEDTIAYGSVSQCRKVGEGIWMLGNNSLRGGVISGTFKGGEFRAFGEVTLNFILLSEEPDVGRLKEDPGLDIIIDGSNRSWYTRNSEQKYKGIYHTDKKGAYRVRW